MNKYILTFEDFKKKGTKKNLTSNERIDFPNKYRDGFDKIILDDILSKLPSLNHEDSTFLDIGIGCGSLGLFLFNHCQDKSIKTDLIDSFEMLNQLPSDKKIKKHNFFFPDCKNFIKKHLNHYDSILCYSVLQYMFQEAPITHILDRMLSLLAPNGRLLIGDIPNINKRKRFFKSPSGIKFHKNFMKDNSLPTFVDDEILEYEIDDSLIFFILQRSRNLGYQSYIVPQNENLPMSNRREDILIIKP